MVASGSFVHARMKRFTVGIVQQAPRKHIMTCVLQARHAHRDGALCKVRLAQAQHVGLKPCMLAGLKDRQ
jgi:hypothetical protein